MTTSLLRVVAKVSTYLPLALTVILLIITTFNSDVLKFVPLELMLAVSSLSILLMVVHVETRLGATTAQSEALQLNVENLAKVQQAYLTAITPPIQTKSLAQAFDAVGHKRTRWTRLRIFAISTNQIVTFFNSHKFSVEHCEILLYQPPPTKRRRTSALYANHASYPVETWRSLHKEGRIGTLTIRSYDFLPIEYECIFDDEILLLGLYESDPGDPVEVRVGSVTMAQNSTPQGQKMIEEYLARYDKFFDVCEKHHGPNPFEEAQAPRNTVTP